MEATAVQAILQDSFEQWGLPEAIRFDNGKPWGHPHLKVPTALTLWLVGLGVRVIFGRPGQSTDNAVVERCHGVLEAWVEPSQCASLAQLAARLQAFARCQRERYPACAGRSRQDAFPELAHHPRSYQRAQDAQVWQQERVIVYVARYTFARKVEKNGRITLLTQEYSLGRAFRGQTVTVRLDSATACWVVKDRDGQVLKHFEASQLTYDTIATMRMTYKHFKTKLDVVSDEA